MKCKLGLLILCTVLAIPISLGALSCQTGPSAVGPIKWKAQSGIVATSFGHLYQFKPFADIVNERSKGRLVIELFAPGAIVDAYEQFAAVRKGAVQVAMGVGGFNAKQVPEGDIEQGLPGTFGTTDAAFDFFMNYKDAAFYRLLDEAYREKGVHLLKSCGPINNVLISRQPIRSVDEIKGKKIRASGGGYEDLVKNLGAAPVQLAGAELFMALQTGTVDGVCYPDYGIGTMKFWDAAKGLLLPALGPSSNGICVNLEEYNRLPDDLKDIVEDAAVQSGHILMAGVKERAASILETAAKQYGVQIVTLPDAEFAKIRKAAEPVLDKAAAMTPRSAKLVALIREYLATKK